MIKHGITREKHKAHEIKKFTKKKGNTSSPVKDKRRLHDINIIKKYFPDIKSVLCVGARDTSEVQSFRNHMTPQTIGIDIIPAELYNEIGKLNMILNIDAHEISSNFIDNQFDFVYASHCLEHMVDSEIVMKQIRNVSKMGCFITLPSFNKTYNSHCTMYDLCKFMYESEVMTDESMLNLILANRASLLKDFEYFGDFDIKNFECNLNVKASSRARSGRPEDSKVRMSEYSMLLKWK